MRKIDKTVKELKSDIEDLEKHLKEISKELDDEAKQKASEVVEKTKTVINNSIEKVNKAVDDIKDDEKLDDFLDKLKAKSMEAVENAKAKVDEIAYGTTDTSVDRLHDDIMADFDSLKDSETLKKTTEFLKEIDAKINDWFEKPEVKAAINKAKVTTINVAEKGVEGLKKVLKTDEIKNQDDSDKE